MLQRVLLLLLDLDSCEGEEEEVVVGSSYQEFLHLLLLAHEGEEVAVAVVVVAQLQVVGVLGEVECLVEGVAVLVGVERGDHQHKGKGEEEERHHLAVHHRRSMQEEESGKPLRVRHCRERQQPLCQAKRRARLAFRESVAVTNYKGEKGEGR